MLPITYTDNRYQTRSRKLSWGAKRFPTGVFYRRFLGVVFRSGAMADDGLYSDYQWRKSSLTILRDLEHVGVSFEIGGIDHLRNLNTPCVIVGNHMSLLETVILPGVVQPVKPVTFIVKEKLLTYPVFGSVMRSRNPIAVGRTKPREDLQVVLRQGTDRLKRGISVIVFPQTTRTDTFEPSRFNSIGIKLAARAKVPVVPVALLTDAWRNGRYLKDFGKIDPTRPVKIVFGPPLTIKGRGKIEHGAVIQFIGRTLTQAQAERGKAKGHG